MTFNFTSPKSLSRVSNLLPEDWLSII